MATKVDGNRESVPDARATNCIPINPEIRGGEEWRCTNTKDLGSGSPDTPTLVAEGEAATPPHQKPFKFYIYELN